MPYYEKLALGLGYADVFLQSLRAKRSYRCRNSPFVEYLMRASVLNVAQKKYHAWRSADCCGCKRAAYSQAGRKAMTEMSRIYSDKKFSAGAAMQNGHCVIDNKHFSCLISYSSRRRLSRWAVRLTSTHYFRITRRHHRLLYQPLSHIALSFCLVRIRSLAAVVRPTPSTSTITTITSLL